MLLVAGRVGRFKSKFHYLRYIYDALQHIINCCDGVTLNFDLLTQKRNQVICVPRRTSDKSLAKIRQQILEISRKRKNMGYIRSCCDLDL